MSKLAAAMAQEDERADYFKNETSLIERFVPLEGGVKTHKTQQGIDSIRESLGVTKTKATSAKKGWNMTTKTKDTNKLKEFDVASMDTAAKVADAALKALDKPAVTLISDWFKDNYLKAGHKRLGRILVATAKNGKK